MYSLSTPFYFTSTTNPVDDDKNNIILVIKVGYIPNNRGYKFYFFWQRQNFAFVHQRAKKNIYMDPLTRHQSAAVKVTLQPMHQQVAINVNFQGKQKITCMFGNGWFKFVTNAPLCRNKYESVKTARGCRNKYELVTYAQLCQKKTRTSQPIYALTCRNKIKWTYGKKSL